jgi:DNA helicase-2/ATP-dependent DNA helicase PcrA
MSTFVLSEPAVGPSRIDYAKELNQEQLDVVLHGDGPCLVLAGAGSGKTRTLTYRVASLLERGVDPSSILLLTFTNKAAREMLERVQQLLGYQAAGLWGGTFHSIGSRILRAFAEALGYQPNFTIMDSEDATDLLKAILKDLVIETKARKFPSGSVVQDIISYARNAQQSLEVVLANKYPHFQGCLVDIERVMEHYQTRKKQANAMDFDDLLSLMTTLLEDPNYGPSISERFRYVLVDEYQDTNAIQARMVKGYAQVHKNILVVGDDAQSIYAFRGADVKNILSFPKQWPDAQVFKLLTNYRSTPEILGLANESLSHNTEQFAKDLVAACAHGEKPKLVPCASASQEARFVADQIGALVAQGNRLSSIAVLFRSSAHSQTLEFELIKREIPYEYRGGQKFFERAHIKDVICFLRVRHNAKDEVAWLRVLGLHQGIGGTTAAAFAKQAIQATSLEELGASATALAVLKGKAREGWRVCEETLVRMLAKGDGPAAMIRGVATSAYQEYLEKEYPNWRERLEDLEQLALFAESYQELGAFLGDIALYEDVVAKRQEEGSGRQEDRLILSTIHQAKGLEWHTVFVIHLADQSFPSRRALAEADGLEEERRLFYVAVTRARKQLFLTYPMTVGTDVLMFQAPSTFLEEVPQALFDRVELREPGQAKPARRTAWSWDESGSPAWEETVIEQDRFGNRSKLTSGTPTAWKKSPPSKEIPSSLLKDV